LADAAIAGGADTLCKLTLAGFGSLGALSPGVCNPFSVNRNGINIGEGGALFVLSPDACPIELAGLGESSDAYHVSAPDPDGKGAESAVFSALEDAGLGADEISYVNLHGTGTALNDSMEALAMNRIFQNVPCSSTKAMTGHTLGAAGALEASFLWLTLSPEFNSGEQLPPHLWDGQRDPDLPEIHLTDGREGSAKGVHICLSTSYAFGGNNAAVILRREAP
jgi:3-oxoacyl-[acyl-carrier-protein] synthase-1